MNRRLASLVAGLRRPYFPLRAFVAQETVRRLLHYGVSVGVAMSANFLIVLSLVRLLPAELYAGFALTKASLIVIAGLTGLGLSQAVVRWRADPESRDPILATGLAGTVALAAVGGAALFALLAVLGARRGFSLDPAAVLAAVGAVASYMLANEVLNWMRANHRSKAYVFQCVGRATLQLALITLAVYGLASPTGYLYGLFAAEATFVAIAALVWRQHWRAQEWRIDLRLLGRMLAYGAPHALVISSGFLLTFADRFMLSYLLADQNYVAYYDASYIILSSALGLLIRPYNLFLFPAYTRRYHEQGAEAAVAFIEAAIRRFLAVGFVVSLAMIAGRGLIFATLLPPGYEVGATIFAPVSIGVLLSGVFMGAAGGLYLANRTWIVGAVSLVAFATNLGANYLLIPLFGIDGAAYSTLLAYLVQLGLACHFSRRILPVRVPWFVLAIGSGACFSLQHLSSMIGAS